MSKNTIRDQLKDQYMEEVIRQRDLEWKKELEERDEKLRKELRVRDITFWEETGKQEYALYQMLETRDKAIKMALVSREREWLYSLQHCRDSLRVTTQELINNRGTLESIGKR